MLLVTGQQHAGDFIDLLGDGRVEHRDGDGLLFDLDLTYKVQTRARRDRPGRRDGRELRRRRKLVVCLGDNVFEYAEADADPRLRRGRRRGAIFVKEVPDPERFGVVAYGEDGGDRRRGREGRASWTRATTRRPRATRSSASTASGRTSSDSSAALAPSERGELEITDVNRAYAAARRSRAAARVGGWWRDAGTHESLGGSATLIEETGVNKAGVIAGVSSCCRCALRGRARLVLRGAPREPAAAADRPDERLVLPQGRDPRPPLPRAWPGRPLRLPDGDGHGSSSSTARPARRSPIDIGDENPVAVYVPGHHAHGFEALTDLPLLLPRHRRSTTRPTRTSTRSPGTTRASRHLWSTSTPILSERDSIAS